MNNVSYPSPRQRVCDLPLAERPLSRLHHYGQGVLANSELLALILGSGDALDLARELLHTFGSLHQLARASRAQLLRIHGIGQAQAARLLAWGEASRRLQRPEAVERPRITSPAAGANLLMSQLSHLRQEEMHVILLNTRNHVLGVVPMYRGSLNSCVIRLNELFRPAIEAAAAAVILVHNHPSGDPTPSPEDIQVTRNAVQAGQLLGIDVLDHLVIGNGRYVSLKERGLGFEEGWQR